MSNVANRQTLSGRNELGGRPDPGVLSSWDLLKVTSKSACTLCEAFLTLPYFGDFASAGSSANVTLAKTQEIISLYVLLRSSIIMGC